MTVAIGPVLLLLASILLGAVLLLAAIGITLWIIRRKRQTRDGSAGRTWELDANNITGRDRNSVVAPGK